MKDLEKAISKYQAGQGDLIYDTVTCELVCTDNFYVDGNYLNPNKVDMSEECNLRRVEINKENIEKLIFELMKSHEIKYKVTGTDIKQIIDIENELSLMR